MDDNLPAPLTTEDDDVRGLDGFMLNAKRLQSSELWAISTGDEFKAAMGLWCRAWEQTPAGSLPDDMRVLAVWSGAGPKWSKVKEMALRGFVKCSDGRLYHKTLCEDVKKASGIRAENRERTKAAVEARRNKRDVQRHKESDVQRGAETVATVTFTQDKTRQDKTIEDSEIRRVREPLAELEAKLRQAAGWENQPAPNLLVTGPIQALIDNGADIDLDVLPVVKALAHRVRSPTGWKYFIDAIAQARDDRIRAASTVGAAHDRTGSKPTRKSDLEILHEIHDELGSEGNHQAG